MFSEDPKYGTGTSHAASGGPYGGRPVGIGVFAAIDHGQGRGGQAGADCSSAGRRAICHEYQSHRGSGPFICLQMGGAIQPPRGGGVV